MSKSTTGLNYYYEIGRKINLLLRVGQLLMENGADTNRIVRTMNRVAMYTGISHDHLHIHITVTTIMVNVGDEHGDRSITKFQKCYKHGIDMTILSAVSKLSWRAIEENFSLDTFEERLDFICMRPRFYKTPVVIVGAGMACGGFSLLFGCDIFAFIYTSICAMIGFITRMRCNKLGFNPYASIAISAFTASCLAYATHFLPTATPWHPLIACSLFIVPGIPLINSVDDLVDGFVVSGITRAMNTLLMVGSMTFGIVSAIKLFNVDIFTDVNILASNSYFVCAIAAAIAAVGFSTIFNTPPRLLFTVALGAVIAVSLRNFLMFKLEFEQASASLIGAVVVSLIALKVVHIVHTPSHVLTIPSVIPMIPGVLMYRLLFNIFNISHLSGTDYRYMVENGVHAMMIILGIAIGVAIPNIFLRKYLYDMKEKKFLTMLNESKIND